MKQVFTLLAIVCFAMEGFAQDPKDSTGVPANDTIRVGNIVIVRSGKDRGRMYYDSTERRFRRSQSNVSTNWLVLDLGVNQVNDKTAYGEDIASGILPPGANENWFDQRFLKSTNVNIWFFVQRLNMVQHIVNLKYGLGIELNNYRYTDPVRFQETNQPMVIMENLSYKKNKLAADYVTVPLMVNFNFTPNRRDLGFGFSAGMSAGYLYSARQKTVGGGMGKKKVHDDFNLRKVKLAYIAEISLGPVRIYGSYATKSMFKSGLDQTPYSFGLRASNW